MAVWYLLSEHGCTAATSPPSQPMMSDIQNSKPTPNRRSSRFQPAVHQIPTPGVENARAPRYEPFVLHPWLVRGVSAFMVCIGIALQIALFVSQTRNGFPVPQKNVISFASTHFLTSTIPILVVLPLALFWTSADWLLRWYQPYVTLSQERSSASRSILLDYVALNQLAVLQNSWTYKHYLIGVSTFIALLSNAFQPLAGALLQLQDVPHSSESIAFLSQTVGLSPTVGNLDGFLAATGFALASVYDDLIDPPFVHGVWAAGKFQAPSSLSYLNATIAVNTTAIRTEVNCVSPNSLNVTSTGGSYVASATFASGCSATNSFNPNNGTTQFSAVNAPSCTLQSLDVEFQPVVFWFYLNATSPLVASVYCNPTMNVFTVETSMNLSTAALGPCTAVEPAQGSNNVTGSPLNGLPYNGVVFDSSNDFYTSSRAQAINFGVPDAIFRYASRQPGGPLSVFQNQYGFVNATTLIYTQHLSTAAQTNYFLAGNSTIPAVLTNFVPRLFVEPIPALVLSPLFIAIGTVGLALHHLHTRARRKLWLTSPPGSIASIVSLTSRSGFGELLLPYDDEQRMENNLAGLYFYLDQRTGAIVAEEDFSPGEISDGVALLTRERQYDEPETQKHLDP